MARPPLPLGKHGSIAVSENGPPYVARCRYRGFDGRTVQLERRGKTRTAARNALQDALNDQSKTSEPTNVLSRHSRFRHAAEIYWTKINDKREDTTARTYEFWLDRVILPALGELLLRPECDAARIDAFFTGPAAHYAASTRRTFRAIIRGVLQQAVLHGVIDTNPVNELERIEESGGRRRTPARGLLVAERRRLFAWLEGEPQDRNMARKQKIAHDADIPDIMSFGLGTGYRISEICGVRICDLELDGIDVPGDDGLLWVPVVAMAGNMVWVKGKGLVRHDGKSPAALRLTPLPEFLVTRLRPRVDAAEDPMMPLFPAAGADGRPTFRWPSNVRRSVRAVRAEVGLDWMTPHTWRRTYATILDDEMTMTDRMKADLLGQAQFLKQTYVSRGELHPNAAVVLDEALR